MQGKCSLRIGESQEGSRQRNSHPEEYERVVSLMTRLGKEWSEQQRIEHLKSLIAAKAYRPNPEQMADAFLSKELGWKDGFGP